MELKDRLTSFCEPHIQELLVLGAAQAAVEEGVTTGTTNDVLLQCFGTMLGLLFEDAELLDGAKAAELLIEDLKAAIPRVMKPAPVKGRAYRTEEN
jgi:hypothetical protein